MTEATIFDTITQIGGVLGTGASLVLFWLYNKIKEHTIKIENLEKENDSLKQTLADIRSDVSYIRGKLEDN